MIEELILQREHERCAALVSGDVEALGTCLSEELVFCHSNGTYDTKVSLLEKLLSGQLKYLSASTSQEKIQYVSGVVLLHAKFQAKVQIGQRQVTIYNQVLSVWVKEQDMWRQIAYQPTPIKPA